MVLVIVFLNFLRIVVSSAQKGRALLISSTRHVLLVIANFYFVSFFSWSSLVQPNCYSVQVISRKDQAQYWFHSSQPYHHISVEKFVESFKAHYLGKKLSRELSQPRSLLRTCKCALSFTKYSLSRKQLFRACTSREWLLVKRNLFVYVFKSVQVDITGHQQNHFYRFFFILLTKLFCLQLLFLGFITMTVFCRTHMRVDQVHANYYMGALFFSLLLILINNNPELIMTISRLAVFYKHRDSYFYPAWAFSLPPSVLKIPHSFVASLLFTSLTYYVIGYSPEIGRCVHPHTWLRLLSR